VHPILGDTGSLLFRAELNAYTKKFSGIVILKRTSSDTSHLVFITQLGMKMFDYEIVIL
jgi:hypothetical protein